MRISKILCAVMLIAVLITPTSFAKGDEKYKGFDEKMCKKFEMIYENKDELDLSEDQKEKLLDAKMKLKRDLIRKEADIKLLALDIKSELYKDEIDTKTINPMIDKKYAMKAEKTKASVAAYATIKDTLSEKQMETLKELYKKCEKEEYYKKCPMMGKRYHHDEDDDD